LNKFYGVEQENAVYFLIPLSVASFVSPIFLGSFLDKSRKLAILVFYVTVGILLSLHSFLFLYDLLSLTNFMILLTIIFIIASPGASAAHLIVSEIFPNEIRSQMLAIFFFVGFGSGGIIAPFFFGWMIEQGSRDYISMGYFLSAFLMIFAGIFGYFQGIEA